LEQRQTFRIWPFFPVDRRILAMADPRVTIISSVIYCSCQPMKANATVLFWIAYHA
jgi:hypothetical protein